MRGFQTALEDEAFVALNDESASTESRVLAQRTDRQLVDIVLAGDETAFEQLFDRHKHMVVKLAGRYFRQPEEAEEILQITFAKAFVELHTFGSGITILDPVGGHRYLIDSALKTARIAQLKPGKAVTVRGTVSMDPAKFAEMKKLAETHRANTKMYRVEGRITDEGKAALAPMPPMPPMAITIPAVPGMPPVPFGAGHHSDYDSQTEELGSRDFEGVMADGQRTVTTIPADAIGNERPLEISYERWYSNELELVVYSKHSDPRFGDQTYKLTNLVRSEPDPSLFTLPQGYKLLSEPGAVYRFKSGEDAYRKAAEEYQKVVIAKPASAPAVVTKP